MHTVLPLLAIHRPPLGHTRTPLCHYWPIIDHLKAMQALHYLDSPLNNHSKATHQLFCHTDTHRPPQGHTHYFATIDTHWPLYNHTLIPVRHFITLGCFITRTLYSNSLLMNSSKTNVLYALQLSSLSNEIFTTRFTIQPYQGSK